MSDAEVEQKFRKLCKGNVERDRCEAIVNAVRNLERARDIGELIELVRLE